VTSHDFNLLIVAIIVIVTIAGRLRGVRRRFGNWAAQQQASAQQAVATVRQAAAAEIAAQQAAAAQAAARQRGAAAPPPVYVPPAYANRPAPSAALPAAAPRRIPPPSMRSTDVPAFGAAPAALRPRTVLAQAFADPSHARGAVILAEVLGKPLALR
jgi:Sec-independent protein translocase protein TatA